MGALFESIMHRANVPAAHACMAIERNCSFPTVRLEAQEIFERSGLQALSAKLFICPASVHWFNPVYLQIDTNRILITLSHSVRAKASLCSRQSTRHSSDTCATSSLALTGPRPWARLHVTLLAL